MSRREFQFEEGSSRKFWAVTLSGSEFKVEWGRLGTAGQMQTKTFSSDAEAKKQCDKLIAEKSSKGYKEVGGAAVAGVAAVANVTAAAVTVKVAAKPDAPAAKPVAAPPTLTPTPAPVSLEMRREIHLNPGDWQVATWRKRVALEKPALRPFDQAAAVKMVSKIKPGTYGWDWKWEKLGIPSLVSKLEAEFWLTAMSIPAQKGGDTKVTPEEVAERVAKLNFTGELPIQDIYKLLAAGALRGGATTIKLAASIMSPIQLVQMLLNIGESNPRDPNSPFGWQFGTDSIAGFRNDVAPYLTPAEMDAVRKLVEPHIDPKNWPADHSKRPSPAFYLGAMCGFHDQLLATLGTIPEDKYTASGWDHAYYHQTQLIVLGLGTAELVQSEMRRLKLRLNRETHIRGWLATTEYAGLEYLRDSILLETNAEEAAMQLGLMGLVEAPEAAAPMLELKAGSRAPRVAREWLEKYPACAVAGLAPAAAGRGKLADAAIEHLADMKRKGYAELIAKAAEGNERLTKEVVEREEKVLPELTEPPAWLASGEASRAKLPTWAVAEGLPPLVVKGKRLTAEHVGAVLRSLQKYGGGASDALLKGLKEEGDAESNDAFAWRLFDLWLSDGAPSKEKWAMQAIGHLGGDKSALKLTPMIRAWPGESQHQRAVSGLECLRAMGTDTALMCLNGIAQKLKFKGLKTKAQEMMEGIAADRKMPRSELEDRIVPDCDLDEKGTRLFDFGPRQFKFVLGPEMKAMVKDGEGKVRGDLPAPNSKDDAEKANAAVEEWKLLKKQIKEVAKIQAERLEQSMVTGRRWKTQDFIALLMKHPLMFNLVRLLVWGGFDANNKLVGTFRVTEDQTCADEKDDMCELGGFTYVGIIHALQLPADAARAWGQVFGDYEIMPPFRQLGRPVNALEKSELKDKKLNRWKEIKIPATSLVGTLERLAWECGVPQDAGVFHEHSKQFPGANVTAVVQYEIGVPVGYMEGWEDQEISECFFVPGLYTPRMYPTHKDSLELGEVDPVVISEVLTDLILLASKGK